VQNYAKSPNRASNPVPKSPMAGKNTKNAVNQVYPYRLTKIGEK
jgi:hypothetical protein